MPSPLSANSPIEPSAEPPTKTPTKTPTEVEPSAALAPWRSPLSRALHRNRSQAFSRYLQLATVRQNGTPANRTVVFRGFLGDTNQLMFISDRRSEKITQISNNPQAEACWYFTKTREQFRLTGIITLITTDSADSANNSGQTDLFNARQQIWQNISANAKIQFAWPQPKAPRAEPDAFRPSAPDENTPPPTFCLMLLTVNTVEHLSLRGEPQNRILYQRITPQVAPPVNPKTNCAADDVSAAQWEVISVNP